MVFEAHNRAFAGFGGVPLAGVCDNPKPIVTTVFAGKEREFNRRFRALTNRYLVEPIACAPASGWEKGQVENQAGNVREWLFTPRLSFAGFAELNAWLEQRRRELAGRFHPEQGGRRIAEVFEEERPLLRPFTAAFGGHFEQTVRASSTCPVAYDRDRYCVPAEHAGKTVSLRAYADRIVVVAEGRAVAEHPEVSRAGGLSSTLGTICPCGKGSPPRCATARLSSSGIPRSRCARPWGCSSSKRAATRPSSNCRC